MRLCDCTFCCSFKKCYGVIAFFDTLFNSAIVRSPFLVAFFKSGIVQLHFFSHFSKVRQKERSHNRSFEKSKCTKCALAHFQSVQLPNPALFALLLHSLLKHLIVFSTIFFFFYNSLFIYFFSNFKSTRRLFAESLSKNPPFASKQHCWKNFLTFYVYFQLTIAY